MSDTTTTELTMAEIRALLRELTERLQRRAAQIEAEAKRLK